MSSESSFSRVLRGYDTSEVDALVQKLRRELLAAKTLHDETVAELKAQTERIAELELELSVQASPTPQGLDAKLTKQIKQAEKLASQIVQDAESDALLIRSAAEKTSSQFVDAAREGYEQARIEAQSMVATLHQEAQERATEILTAATEQAENIVAEARADAQRIQGEIATLGAKLRADSRNEASRIIAEAQREAEELRLVLASNRDSSVNVSDEIMQLLKLNADGAAVRAQMEADIQARHQEAVMQTDKYISAADALLASSRTAQRELEAQLEQVEVTVESDAEAIVSTARAQATRIEDAAAKQGRKIIADAEKYAAAVLVSIYQQLEDVRLERESVASFFDALRLELEKTLPVAKSATKRSTKKELPS